MAWVRLPGDLPHRPRKALHPVVIEPVAEALIDRNGYQAPQEIRIVEGRHEFNSVLVDVFKVVVKVSSLVVLQQENVVSACWLDPSVDALELGLYRGSESAHDASVIVPRECQLRRTAPRFEGVLACRGQISFSHQVDQLGVEVDVATAHASTVPGKYDPPELRFL